MDRPLVFRSRTEELVTDEAEEGLGLFGEVDGEDNGVADRLVRTEEAGEPGLVFALKDREKPSLREKKLHRLSVLFSNAPSPRLCA